MHGTNVKKKTHTAFVSDAGNSRYAVRHTRKVRNRMSIVSLTQDRVQLRPRVPEKMWNWQIKWDVSFSFNTAVFLHMSLVTDMAQNNEYQEQGYNRIRPRRKLKSNRFAFSVFTSNIRIKWYVASITPLIRSYVFIVNQLINGLYQSLTLKNKTGDSPCS